MPAANRLAIAISFALATALSPALAHAQTAPGSGQGPLVQHAPGGIDFMSGGAGEEDRSAMAAHSTELPFKIVLSGTGGAYVVADRLVVRSSQGEVLVVRDAGPIVMMRLPAGGYTLEATVQGSTQQRQVKVGSGAQTVEWRWAT
jgi:hypothetical protein